MMVLRKSLCAFVFVSLTCIGTAHAGIIALSCKPNEEPGFYLPRTLWVDLDNRTVTVRLGQSVLGTVRAEITATTIRYTDPQGGIIDQELNRVTGLLTGTCHPGTCERSVSYQCELSNEPMPATKF
jgi:hypothetical protein